MSDHNEAMRLADRISPETDWYEFDQVTWCNEAAALIRKQAERIAELERLSTGLSTVYNEAMDSLRIAVDERDTLRAEVERLRVDGERWGKFIGLSYQVRAEWAANLSLVPVLTSWVDRLPAIDTARKATP